MINELLSIMRLSVLRDNGISTILFLNILILRHTRKKKRTKNC